MWLLLFFSGMVGIASLGSRSKHSLPDLPYDYNALEPVISADIMQLHHSKHHQTYVNNLNAAEEKLAEAQAKGLLCKLIFNYVSLFTAEKCCFADSRCLLKQPQNVLYH